MEKDPTELNQEIIEKISFYVKKNKLSNAEQLVLLTMKNPEGEIDMSKKGLGKGHVYPKEPFPPSNPFLVHYISITSTNRHAKRASQFLEKMYVTKPETPIKENFTDFIGENFPGLLLRLQKKSVRYILNKFDWEFTELKLKHSKKLLGIACEDFFHEGLLDVTRRLIEVYGLVSKEDDEENFHIEKIEIIEWMKTGLKDMQGSDVLENKLSTEDYFGNF